MSDARKHHFISRFLLRGFAVPEEDDGRLFVLDRTHKIVFQSSPANSGHRRDYNRLEKGTHPDPLVVESFYANIESRAAPVIQLIRTTKALPPRAETEKVLHLVAIHFTRTPRFRRRIEGELLEALEQKILEVGQNAFGRRRFAQKQRKYGLPEECWTPEGFIARLKSGDFSTKTDDNWKIAIAIQWLPLIANILRSRRWGIIEFPTTLETLILSDAVVGLLPVGRPGPNPVGLALPNTIIYLPISNRLVLVGAYPQLCPLLETAAICPLLLNSTSFALFLDQCFSSQSDFNIDDPDRGPTPWTTYQQENRFPKLFDDASDLADVYAGRKG